MYPRHLKIVANIPVRFGKTANGRQNSFIFARVNAFSSNACLGKISEPISLGAPVRGVPELTDSTYGSALLVGGSCAPFRLEPPTPTPPTPPAILFLTFLTS